MPRLEQSSAQRRIGHAIEKVFEVVADPEMQPRWYQAEEHKQREQLSVRHASGPRIGNGSRFIRLREDPEGHQKVDRIETVVYEAPERIRFSDGTSFVLERDGDASTIVTAFDEKQRGSAIGTGVRKLLKSEPKLATRETLAGRLERIEQVVAARAG